MAFRSAMNSLWGIIKSPFILAPTITPSSPATSNNIPTPPPEDKHIECDTTTNDKFLSVDCTRVSNLSAETSMPGAYHPDLLAPSTSSIRCPGYGFCSSFISTSPSPLSRYEEVEFDYTGFAVYSTPKGPPTCASSPPSPHGGDRPAEPVTSSYRSPTSSFPGRSGLAGFTPSANGNFSTLSPPDSTRSTESTAPGGYSTSPSPGCSGLGYPAPSTNSSFSSSATSFLPFSPPSPPSSPPQLSTPLSGLSTGPAVAANFPSTQDNNSLQSSSKQECKLDTKVVNIPECLSGNQVLSEPTQARSSEERIPTPHKRPPFQKNREPRQCPSDTTIVEDLLESELPSGKFIGENEHASYARKRALELETDIEVRAAPNATPTKPSRIPVLKKARLSAKSSDSNTTAEAAGTARGNIDAGVPPKIPPRTRPARMATQAEPSASTPRPPPPYHITPVKLETPGTCWRRKHAQDDDSAKDPTNKKLKMDPGSTHKKTSKGKQRKVINSGKTPRRPKAIPSPSNGKPASYLPRPTKPHNPSAPTGEPAGGHQAAPTQEARPVKGASVTPPAKATCSRKRTSENTIVKSAITKKPRKKYFLRGMVLSDDSSDDEETGDEKPDTTGAQPATPLEAAHTSTTPSAAPANTPKLESPLASILGKRTSTDAHGFHARDTGLRENLVEALALKHEQDLEELMANSRFPRRNRPRRSTADYRTIAPEAPSKGLRNCPHSGRCDGEGGNCINLGPKRAKTAHPPSTGKRES